MHRRRCIIVWGNNINITHLKQHLVLQLHWLASTIKQEKERVFHFMQQTWKKNFFRSFTATSWTGVHFFLMFTLTNLLTLMLPHNRLAVGIFQTLGT